MKIKNQITSLALILLAMTITSCQKEILDLTENEARKGQKNTELISEEDQGKSDPEFVLTTNTAISVDISVSACPTGGGVNVTATSDEANLSSGAYTIYWYKNTEQAVLLEGQTLECVCQMGVRVEVYDSEGELVGENSMDLPAC